LKIKYHIYLFFFLIFFQPFCKAQFFNLPTEYFSSLLTERELAKKENQLHTGIKPYIHFYSPKYLHVIDSHSVYKYIHEDAGVDAVFYNHLINIAPKNENINIKIDPIINFELGNDFLDTLNQRLFTNTRGAMVSGSIGPKVYFETMFSENQALFPAYIYNSSNVSKVVPGQGRFKNFKTYGFDFAFASGFVSIQATKNFNLQLGHGKQKVGHGYRSLLLSDNAFNYPYLRFTEQWLDGKIQYSSIYAVLMNFAPAAKKQTYGIEPLLQKKAAAFQHLSFNPGKRLNFSFFQGLIWKAGDERNRHQLDWQYFNPVIFSNVAVYGLNQRNNLLIGADMKFKLTDKINVYYQAMADDLSNTDTLGNGYGQQIGVNCFDAFGIKHLFLQAEYNYVSEGSYRNIQSSGTNQGYNHYNQNLAYTPGYGQELILLMDYKIKRFNINLKYNYQDVPLNQKPYYYNNMATVRLAYTINTAYNFNANIGYTYRSQNFVNFKNLNNEAGCFFIGLKTNLYNFYYDF